MTTDSFDYLVGWRPEQPPPDAVLWRYMPFAVFVALIRTRSLGFASRESFDDKLEGSFGQADVEDTIQRILRDPANADAIVSAVDMLSVREPELRVNCWHASDHESEAMWYRYGRGSNDVVAIKSTYANLLSSLSCAYIAGRVSYDADVTPAPDTLMERLFRKRAPYSQEKEIRVVCEAPFSRRRAERAPAHAPIAVDLRKLVSGVLVHPLSGDWFLELVKGLTAETVTGVEVRRSVLAASPIDFAASVEQRLDIVSLAELNCVSCEGTGWEPDPGDDGDEKAAAILGRRLCLACGIATKLVAREQSIKSGK